MLNPRSIDDPASSWGSTNNKVSNASGVTFDVEYMGYVPIPKSISNRTLEEKDRIVRICVQSVVFSQPSSQFKALLAEKIVDPFFSVDHLKVFLNIGKYLLNFFYITNGRTLLLGRYRNNKLSHYKIVRDNGRIYIGLVMIKSHREEIRECNVLKVRNETICAELIKKLEEIDEVEQSKVEKLDGRLKSTQEFSYRNSMIPFYHGRISREEAIARLSQPGDFLMRDMTSGQVDDQIVITYLDAAGKPQRRPTDMKLFLKNWQNPDFQRHFKIPVLRPYDD